MHPDPPLRRAYLPLGELTVLLGPNDSGKSTLLRAVTRDLQGGHFGGGDQHGERLVGGVFYAEVSGAELNAMIRTSEGARGRSSFTRTFRPDRRPYTDGLWKTGLEPGEVEDDPRGALLAKLAERETEDPHGQATLLEALGTSRVVAIECAGHAATGDRLAWNLYWCVPPLAELEDGVVAALRASDLQPFRQERERAAGDTTFRGLGMYEALYGRPRHLWVDGAPVAIASLGLSIDVPMPKGLAVPADFGALHGAVSDSATGLITSAVHGLHDAALDGDDLDTEERAERTAPRAWLTKKDGWVGLSEEAVAAFRFVAAAANRRLPRFLNERYQLETRVGDIDRWLERPPLQLMVAATDTGGIVEDFPVEQVAEGYRLWVQLAVLNALEDAGRLQSLLGLRASDWYDAERDIANRGAEPDEDELEALAEAERRFEAVRQALIDLGAPGAKWVTGEAEQALAAVPGDDWTRGGTRERRLLVIDEPERHLQPALQREAARWLAATATATRAPMLIATHSPAFLSLPPTRRRSSR
jgi:hypothetical protein